jgi:hypothetical protein
MAKGAGKAGDVKGASTGRAAGTQSPSSGGSPVAQIETAYMRVSGGQENVRVHLADLREATPNLTRAEFDAALMNLAISGKASLYQNDNPSQVGPRERAAAFHTPGGSPRHIIYLGGRGSGRG